jgi:hypothetical protein
MSTVVACPVCQQQVPVPDEQLGQPLRCPGCEQVFTPSNTAIRSPVPPPLPPDEAPVWERPPEDDLAKPLDDDEAPDVEADAQEGERRPREAKKSRRKDGRESGYFGELARKQRKMLTPNRGPMVLVLGIVSLLFCPCGIFAIGACACGYYAYQMGSYDVQEMYAGRMDPSGETLAKIGRILGVAGMVLSAPVILLSLGGMILWLINAIVA